MVDINKIDGKFYKDSEYSGLYRYIFDIEKPKNLEFQSVLRQHLDSKKPLKEAEYELMMFLENPLSKTPWYSRWKKWFLDKTRFKDHELLD